MNLVLGQVALPTVDPTIEASNDERPWYWEGTVQEKVSAHLQSAGYKVTKTADTNSREAGKDIEAVGPDGKPLWISVKGFPESSRHTPARHWFSGALFDMILYREESKSVDLAIALPDGFTTYRNLAARIRWFRKSVPMTIFWVEESGEVRST